MRESASEVVDLREVKDMSMLSFIRQSGSIHSACWDRHRTPSRYQRIPCCNP